GPIPSELGRLFRLRKLFLDRNELEGSIPFTLGNCKNLTVLSLTSNYLHGNISRELGFLEHLQFLYLGENSLSGSIPSSLGNLSSWIHFSLPGNNLTGFIPVNLGMLTELEQLWIFENDLSGTIPASLSNISTLTDLDISTNKLSGSIPKELSLLTHLQILYLNRNNFVATIPNSLSNISTLTDLDISTNKLGGGIPQELSHLHLLTLLLGNNELSGTIPISLSNISSLNQLDISTNKLTGLVPQELGLLTQMTKLHLDQNQLTGPVPSSLSNCSSLEELALSQNQLTGNIPWEFDKLINLTALGLWGNQLSRTIPNSIGNCSKLQQLLLSKNNFSGIVPNELGKLSLLKKLTLSSNFLVSGSNTPLPFLTALTNCSFLEIITFGGNKFSGVLPHTIGLLSPKLSFLSLQRNNITGSIPPEIGNLTNVAFLELSENFFQGSIPSFKRLFFLERLYLQYNSLEGSIPDDLGQLNHLGLLDMSNNMLSGEIPGSLCHLQQLRRLFLHHNQLSQSIPTCFGDCKNLELLDLSHNRLKGKIPREVASLSNLQFYLNLSWNLLEGPLPTEMSKLVMVLAIDVSANHLSGLIPPAIGSCSALESLNLSKNALHGPVPYSLGDLQNLIELDLSSNSLSGTVPVSLENLKALHYVNFSFNNLTGQVPVQVFRNGGIVVSLDGNPGLCGPRVLSLPTCPKQRGHSALLKKVLIPIFVVTACILLGLLSGFLWRCKLGAPRFNSPESFLKKLERRKISHEELAAATNGFNDTNLLGTGSFGSVYKGILSDGTFVAVKVLNLQAEQVHSSFKAECNVLQKVRHRNLVKIITSCSKPDFRALVFEYMSNGSLEKHLYPERDHSNDEEACELGFKTRLQIATDIANAMEYLHHFSSVQVVHCDLKPSNVLMDEGMTAHVTDFGISRLTTATSTDSLVSTLTLKGSIGYIPPEYGLTGRVSTKGDVYSFGILLLEMLTRKSPTNDMFVGNLNLHKWVNFAFPDRVADVIDSTLLREVGNNEMEENGVFKNLISFLNIGLVCSRDSPDERPTMREVANMLGNIKEALEGFA
ncbi:hypothetical protein KI387_001010, partial [Taxus chinensis]